MFEAAALLRRRLGIFKTKRIPRSRDIRRVASCRCLFLQPTTSPSSPICTVSSLFLPTILHAAATPDSALPIAGRGMNLVPIFVPTSSLKYCLRGANLPDATTLNPSFNDATTSTLSAFAWTSTPALYVQSPLSSKGTIARPAITIATSNDGPEPTSSAGT